MSAVRRGMILGAALVAFVAASLPAQAPDSVSLARLEARALQRDPRAVQLGLVAAQAELRRANIDADRRPALSVNGVAQYQSDVLTLPFQLPGGQLPPTPRHDTYDARVDVLQRLVDPTIAARLGAEDAQLDVARSRVRVMLYGVRQAVQDAYFRALLLQSRASEIRASITDLQAQRHVAAERLRLGSALPSEVASLDAELLRRGQALAEAVAARQAALALLSELTGARIADTVTLGLPELGSATPRLDSAASPQPTRPEYAEFASERTLLERQEAIAAARDRPRLSAFGRIGYGRPGLNPLSTRFDSYWLAGLQVQWTPVSWGVTRREREVLALQRQVVTSEEAAFAESLARTVAESRPDIERLEATRASDDEIVTLRERILAESRLRYTEGVVSSAEYVDRQTDLLVARIARASHAVELAQARARLLVRLGLETP